ncbi:50S ribosomal protein L4 [Candidatus Sumerlaeota bacterium]|nr:50S ribosomal protein L4 [Candidatus Sumerlaeota bacterium]
MPSVSVVNIQGSKVEKIDLAPGVFEARISTDCVRAAVNNQLAHRRQGTAATKTRGLVSGGGIKPYRQKGTGRARAGSTRSPVRRHGGVVFGPMPRSYGGKVNRKVLRSAILSCLTSFAQEGQIVIVDALDFSEPKTRQVSELLSHLKIEDKRVLFLTDRTNVNLALSARNIPWVDVINCDNLNTFDLTTHDVLVATKAAIERLEEVYA